VKDDAWFQQNHPDFLTGKTAKIGTGTTKILASV
jgi:hypothetical protein